MKRISHFFIVLIGICTALVLGYLFTVIYTEVGNALLVHDSKTITLYKVLTEINFSSIAVAFGMAFAYMFLLDLLFKTRKNRNTSQKLLIFGFVIGRYILPLFYFQSSLPYRLLHQQ